MGNKVVIGLSGGVDSSVAAYLLQQEGYEVSALFMVNWHDRTGSLVGSCTWEDDWDLAQMVAKKLNMPIELVDLSEYYKKRVVDYMFAEYASGRTPNPDVLCNREIKFDIFMDKALETGADFVATGHYCRKKTSTVDGQEHYDLLAGLDPNKDQSYFLCQLNQQQLSKALFPIGELQKSEVRAIAQLAELPTATRKDSQGICFVGKVDLPTFLQQQLEAKTGDIIELEENYFDNYSLRGSDYKHLSKPYVYSPEAGQVVGQHRGAHFFTIGQRKGLNVGGKALPLFVLAIDVEQNIVYVGQGHDFPGLLRKALFIHSRDIHYTHPAHALPIGSSLRCKIRIRYRQALQDGTLYAHEEGMYILFDQTQRAVSPGQFAAWYIDEQLQGSGVIAH